VNPLFADLPTSVFARMSALAAEHGAVNLGQGFPDFGWPDDVLARAADALLTGSNQYAPMRGLTDLRRVTRSCCFSRSMTPICRWCAGPGACRGSSG
jgi:aspartate/methionine/tyrosine aminotransferase